MRKKVVKLIFYNFMITPAQYLLPDASKNNCQLVKIHEPVLSDCPAIFFIIKFTIQKLYDNSNALLTGFEITVKYLLVVQSQQIRGVIIQYLTIYQ